ncbi:histidine kinase [Microbacterium sp. A196]|uniref:histidine kinase n=1 Tax=unclassified Microbacterium TaxID=2609290 RepID=UPI003FD0022A
MAYGVVALGLTVLSLEPPYATPLWVMILLAAGGFTTLALRHRRPYVAFTAAMALAVLSLAVGSGAETLIALIAMYSAGVKWRAAVTWMLFGVAALCGALGALALTMRGTVGPPILGLQPPIAPRDSLQDWANFFLIIIVVLLIATLLGTSVGHRRRYIRELVHRADQLARERDQQAETARARERERIAREMHDVIAHSLSVMIAISDGAYLAADTRPAEAKEAIGRVAETGRKTLGEVRRLLGSVRADGSGNEHAPQPDASQLASLVQEFVTAGLPARLTITGQAVPDPALGLTVYRIVQESLTNVLRHARDVEAVTISVVWQREEVTILVQDVSSIPSTPSDAGRGVLGMQERVALYDGEVSAGPYDRGWCVFARLRWEDR